MKELYNKNFKTLLKEVKEDTNKWKDISCLWILIVNVKEWLQHHLEGLSSLWLDPTLEFLIPQAWSRSRSCISNTLPGAAAGPGATL